MTDNEIIKALECRMPFDKVCVEAYDLINRQKAEIERLREAYLVYEETTGLKWARTEAVKEFAKKWKAKLVITYCTCGKRIDITENFNDCVDILVKEMTEDEGNG